MTGRTGALLRRSAAALAGAAVALGGVAVLLCFALVCYSVAMRYFLGDPISWSDEVTGWLVLAVVMLGMADAQARGEHIGVDLLIDKSGPRAKRRLGLFGAALVAACGAMIAWHGVEMVRFSSMLDLRSNTLGWAALWPVQVLVPLGGLLLLAVALAQLAAPEADRPEEHKDKTPPKSHE